jgi:ferredoxin-nitrite reductase
MIGRHATEAVLEPTGLSDSAISNASEAPQPTDIRAKPSPNAIEGYKASKDGNGLRVLDDLPEVIARGAGALTPAEKELLKWVGVFFRRPTPGKFMMRVRMPNGFATSAQLRAIADLSRRLGNNVLDITTRQQLELRGFTLDSIPEIWEKLRGVDLRSLQTGIDNIRNINGCALAGLAPNELFDASHVVQELDRIFVGSDGNPEYTNLPRKFNITVTGCLDNCTHNESQDLALVPARKGGRFGFNVLVGGKMGSGGFTVASSLNVFVEPFEAVTVVTELVKIFRDHGPREARSKCRFAFLIEEWGVRRLRSELVARLGHELEFRGKDMRGSGHSDHLGVVAQRQTGLVAVGLCIPTGRVNPDQLEELARLADEYGNGEIRFTIGQNAIIPNVRNDRVDDLLEERLVKLFSPRPSPFVRGLVACVGTDYCNMALIETKSRAVALSQALKERLGSHGSPLTIHWSGCPAGCGNHQAADIGLRGFKTKIDGKIVDAVAIYVGGRTGPNAIAGREIFETVPCDESLPDIVAGLIQTHRFPSEPADNWMPSNALPAVASWVPIRTLIPDSAASPMADGAD